MDIKVVSDQIKLTELDQLAKAGFGDMVKGVVDIEKKIIALGGELHADEEAILLERGSKQEDLWGINLFPGRFDSPEFIVFDSMINIRPWQHNRSRGVENEQVRQKIIQVISDLIKE